MKYTICLPLLILCGAARAQKTEMTSQMADVIQINRLNKAWMDAYPHHDTATLGRILADDFELVNPSGRKMNRSEVLGSFASTAQTTTVTTDSVQLRLFGDAAVLIGFIHATVTGPGQPQTVHVSYADLYCKRNGLWQAVSAHVAVIP